MTEVEELEAVLRGNRDIASLLDRFGEIGLPDAWIVAGALAQTVWNHAHGFPPGNGVRDIDIIYHDPDDISAAAEARHEARLRAAFPRLSARLDVKNQARVHLWYQQRFGRVIPPYPSSRAAIATFPATATAIGVRRGGVRRGGVRRGGVRRGGVRRGGVRPEPARINVCAPFGLQDLWRGIVRANQALVSAAVYREKAARWAAIWPQLKVLPWCELPGRGNQNFTPV